MRLLTCVNYLKTIYIGFSSWRNDFILSERSQDWRKDNFLNIIFQLSSMCFQPQRMRRKWIGSICVYINRFQKDERNWNFSISQSFLEFNRRLGIEIFSLMLIFSFPLLYHSKNLHDLMIVLHSSAQTKCVYQKVFMLKDAKNYDSMHGTLMQATIKELHVHISKWIQKMLHISEKLFFWLDSIVLWKLWH